MSRPSWDETFLAIAQTLALRGTCSRLQVGAVLVRGNRIISTGYNGAPPAQLHCNHDNSGDLDAAGHCSVAEHAERNALLFARQDMVGATVYITHAPYLSCTRNMVTVGITRIVYRLAYRLDPLLTTMCERAGIRLEVAS